MSLIHPVLFSSKFGIRPADLERAGILDPILNADTKLFIDPLLVRKSTNPIIKRHGRKALENGFKNVVELADLSATDGDAAFKGAVSALNLDERPETGLGYGGTSTRGSSRPVELRRRIVRTTIEIVRLGEKNPAMIPLMAIFEEGVGPDTLSDLATNLLLPALCEITETFCGKHGVPVRHFGTTYSGFSLPENPYRTGQPVLLVPRDLLRDLPLAADWSDVSRVVFEVKEIRDQVNRMIGGLARVTVAEKKAALRRAALSSQASIHQMISAVVGASDSYDARADLDGHYLFREFLGRDRTPFRGLLRQPAAKNQNTLRATVDEIIVQFTSLVEDNNLWELLWNERTPRRERAAQLLFFAVANVICAANDVDISPETNAGGGPVDFKFSTGFKGRVLVELKLSTGAVVHGYQKQLEVYKKASKSEAGILVVVDVGKIGRKLRTIEKEREAASARGETASDIRYVDARRRLSASKG